MKNLQGLFLALAMTTVIGSAASISHAGDPYIKELVKAVQDAQPNAVDILIANNVGYIRWSNDGGAYVYDEDIQKIKDAAKQTNKHLVVINQNFRLPQFLDNSDASRLDREMDAVLDNGLKKQGIVVTHKPQPKLENQQMQNYQPGPFVYQKPTLQDISQMKNKFELLSTCYSGFGNSAYQADGARLNNDFYLAHVQRFSDKSRSSTVTTLGKDNFLVLNKTGAQLMLPGYEMTKLGTDGGIHRQRDYRLTIVGPGEKNEARLNYEIDEQDQSNDTPGWYGAPGWSKESDALDEKYKNNAVTKLSAQDTLDLLKPTLMKQAQNAETQSEKTINQLDSWIHSQQVSNGSGWGTIPSNDPRFVNEKLQYELQRVDTELNNLQACQRLGDGTVQQAAELEQKVLLNKRSFLAGLGGNTSQATISNSAR